METDDLNLSDIDNVVITPDFQFVNIDEFTTSVAPDWGSFTNSAHPKLDILSACVKLSEISGDSELPSMPTLD